MEQVIQLTVGQPYYRPLPTMEGAVVEFLELDTPNSVLVACARYNARELKALITGDIKCTFLYKNGAILFVWQFMDEKGAVLTFDCPFDAKAIQKANGKLAYYDIDSPETRMLISIHIVDSANNLVVALRSITMPPELTLKFLMSAQDALASPLDATNQINNWFKLQPVELAKLDKAYILGL